MLIFFVSQLRNDIYDSLNETLSSSTMTNTTPATDALNRIQQVENDAWDYVFLAVFIGLMLQMVIFSFATRINIAFYWIFTITGIIITIVSVVLSTLWQGTANNPVFAENVLRFPIMNALLGSYFPTAVVVIFFIGLIILFGKRPQSLGGRV